MKKKTYKSGKPGKMLSNQFSGYNNYGSGKGGRVNTFMAMDAPTDIFISDGGGGGGGGVITQDVPNFDDPTPVFIDPVISDPVGIRTSIDNTGTNTYTPATVLYMGTSSPTVPVDPTGPLSVDDTTLDDDLDGGIIVDHAAPPVDQPDPTTETATAPSKKTVLIIILIIIAIIVGYYLYKKYK